VSFEVVVGHRPLVALLARSVERESLPPTLLFSGPEGVGKRLTAIALAQALNCERPGHGNACGKCRACQRIARGVHADVLVVEPGDSGSIKVDQVRDAIERSAYRPFEGRRRVVIVDPADALMSEAQNALLKTLEEPPAGSVFVLITAMPDVLLPTVLSRSHRLRFGALSAAEVAGVLTRDHGYSAADAHAAASAADGSVGRALEENTEDAAEARDTAARVLQASSGSRDPRRRLDAAKLLAGGGGDREEISRRLLALAGLLRDLAAISAGADETVLANADLRPQLQSLGRSFDPDRALSAFSVVDKALDAIDRNASPKIVADWVALNL
jgi:DNA polymerase III subunit delta'